MTPLPHRMPGALFDSVAAGGGGADALRLLARAEHSRRLACVYAVTAAAREFGGEVGEGAEEAWAVLSAAASAAPEEAAAVLVHPATGPALFNELARLMRPDGQRRPKTTWLTALAAASAVRAGLPGQLRWAANGPWLTLPSLGRAHFPNAGRGARAQVHTDSAGLSQITVSGPAGAHDSVVVPESRYGRVGRWHGAYPLTPMDSDVRLLLDVLEQPRFPHAAPYPGGLGAREVRRWTTVAQNGCRLLREEHPEAFAELAAGTRLLVPLARPSQGIVSGSSEETFGCLALSLPGSAAEFAVTVTHEIQHNKFSAVLHLFDLFEPGGRERFYAPWRPDPRPLLGLFHGAYAHLGVAHFWDRRRESEPDPALRTAAHIQFARWRLAAREATLVVLSSNRLTDLGKRFAETMLHSLDALCRRRVPAVAQRRAEAASRAHLAAWQLRNGNAEQMLSA
ncbi:aKG-HExxH-type peptide beta-hydroxylase [Streptomyces sp. NPDC006879]|uniref:aKG-HExxH-type peptide beta-hydroxylase n=1 Tax=Streptomyces sp. NPDC006879 TaxID=3364767 RepID=UPI0036D0D6DE